jgi:serine/threonine/tyrosine protein kinase RAD53
MACFLPVSHTILNIFQNVLLTTDKPPIVKVADFGLAKVVDSLTMLRVCIVVFFARILADEYIQTMCGTPSYLAPEVVRQDNQDGYDNLVDSWSVGVIVFSM